MDSISSRNAPWLRLLGVVVFAGLLAGATSINGLDRDTCISYLAGLRHWSGQTVYQSFFIPHGPVAGWVFSLFLHLLPTGGWALVTASAALNVSATVVVWRILFKTTQSERAGLLGATLTAIWYLPVFGAFYHDHLAYLWGLLALSAWLETGFLSAIACGFFIALSFHTKQTVGLGVFAAFVIALLAKSGQANRSRLALLGAGYLICHGIILCWLSSNGLVTNYFLYTFTYPWNFSRAAPLEKGWQAIASGLVFPFHIAPLRMITEWGWGRLAFYPIVVAVYLGYGSVVRSKTPFALVFALLSTVLGASLLGRLHAHLFFGMAIVIVLLSYRSRWATPIAGAYALLGLGYVFLLHGRIVPADPFFATTDLRPLRIATNSQSKSDEAVIRFLRAHPAEFAMVGDSADLIPLALRRSPWNPSVNFTQLTIPKDPSLLRNWESDFLKAMTVHDVRQIVIADKFLIVFPEIKKRLDAGYFEVLKIDGEPLYVYFRS